nr:hypothetical protein CFP56_59400 [Quercus suber]
MVDYQYEDFLKAIEGRPRVDLFVGNKGGLEYSLEGGGEKSGVSFNKSEGGPNRSKALLQQNRVVMAEGGQCRNPRNDEEGQSKSLGTTPHVQERDRKDLAHADYVVSCTVDMHKSVSELKEILVQKEDELHSGLDAQDIWHGSVKALQKCGTRQPDFVALLEYLLDRMDKKEVELMLVQAWLIWNQRNRVVHKGKFLELGWLNKRDVELLEEFQQSQDILQVDEVLGATRQVLQNAGTGWQPPPQSVYKLNYDAAVFADSTSYGFGVVIRNFSGEVMAAMTAKGSAV